MGLVLTVDNEMALSLNEKVYIEFLECQKGRTEFSVLHTEDEVELEGFLSEEKPYQFLIDEDVVITLTLMKKRAGGREKTRISVDAPKSIVISRVKSNEIPDIEYEFIPLKRQQKRKTLFKKEMNSLPQGELIKPKDSLVEKYQNELSWFFN